MCEICLKLTLKSPEQHQWPQILGNIGKKFINIKVTLKVFPINLSRIATEVVISVLHGLCFFYFYMIKNVSSFITLLEPFLSEKQNPINQKKQNSFIFSK